MRDETAEARESRRFDWLAPGSHRLRGALLQVETRVRAGWVPDDPGQLVRRLEMLLGSDPSPRVALRVIRLAWAMDQADRRARKW